VNAAQPSQPHVQIANSDKTSEVYPKDIPRPVSLTKSKRSRNGWTPRLECALLLAALNNKREIYLSGPGIWMAKPKNQPLLANMSSAALSSRWYAMLRRCPGRTVAETPARDRARLIMATCFAEQGDSGPERDVARGVALLDAGWLVLPPTFGGRRASKKVSSSRWIPPSIDMTRIVNEDSAVSLTHNLEATWELYMEELEQDMTDIVNEPVPSAVDEELEDEDNSEPLQEDKIGTGEMIGGSVDMLAYGNANNNSKDEGNQPAMIVDPKGLPPNQDRIISPPVTVIDVDKPQELYEPKTILSKRRMFVGKNDPRPSLSCCWCGPKNLYKPDKNSIPLCASCKYLESLGWEIFTSRRIDKMKDGSRRYDFTFVSPGPGPRMHHRSVKMFLKASTKYIVMHGGFGQESADADRMIMSAEVLEDRTKKDVPKKLPAPAAYRTRQWTPEGLRELCNSFPTLEESLTHKEGLMGLLKVNYEDWKSVFNCSAYDIAIWVLRRLSKGDISEEVQSEAPFFRPDDELLSFSDSGAPPTRFIGVVRIMEYTPDKSDCGSLQIFKRPTGKFAVEIPSLISVENSTGNMPHGGDKITGFGQRKILLRTDMAEDSAGQLYSYMYRVLFGENAKEQMRNLCNSGAGKEQLIKDTLHSFGVQSSM